MLSEVDRRRHLKVIADHRTGSDGTCIVCYPKQVTPCAYVRDSRVILTAAGVPLGQWIEQ
jgi:cobalamin synthase